LPWWPARAQVALSEITTRQQAEATRAERDAEHLDELSRQAVPVVELDYSAELVRDR